MNNAIRFLALTLLLPGCAATVPNKADTPSQYLAGYDQGFALGKQIGRDQAQDALRNDDAFRVSNYELSECRDEASWLPKQGAISDVQFWSARQRSLWLNKQCRERNAAKIPVIYRMIDRVRGHE